MARVAAGVAFVALVTACGEDPATPDSSGPVAGASPSVALAAPTCPCWNAQALAEALPQADTCVDQTAAATPFLSVDLFDFSAATQTQAFTRYDAGSSEAGSCRLAVVGRQGLVREIAAGSGFPRSDYEGCIALLTERARTAAAGC